MTTDTQELTLEVTRTVPAPPEAVFDAWLDPAMLKRFMLPGDGTSVPSATADPREGGRFALTMRAGDQDIPHAGTYVTIDRATKLVFTWESPFSVDGSTVTLDFTPVAGGTDLRLRHVRFPSEESRDNHNAGWARILETLAGIH